MHYWPSWKQPLKCPVSKQGVLRITSQLLGRDPSNEKIRTGRVLGGKTSLAFLGIPHISYIFLMKGGMIRDSLHIRY